MLPFITQISLLRYLIVWRVNSSLVHLSPYWPLELSQTLGTFIADRLPTREAHEWRQALEAHRAEEPESGRAAETQAPLQPGPVTPIPAPWPMEVVLFAYPGKRTYGEGELILWELKLLGAAADHGLFLERILPAMEEAGTTADPRWRRTNELWGHFDVQAVYAARGPRWEPVVSAGELDLNYRARPTQWLEGLSFGREERRHFHRLTWITPFDLGAEAEERTAPHSIPSLTTNETSPRRRSRSPSRIPEAEVPTLGDLLDALMARLTLLLPGKRRTPEEAWASVDPQDREALRLALQEAQAPGPQAPDLKPVPRGWPGRWIGTQTFRLIPHWFLPYLELASILHVGRQTHFGCGTFRCTVT